MSKYEADHHHIGGEKYETGYDQGQNQQMQEFEVDTPIHMAAEQEGLKRDLRLRHMIMIAISGTIGTGLFLTSGSTIATAGPGGACKSFPFVLAVDVDRTRIAMVGIMFSCRGL